jgi:hypothetical protein
MNIPYISTIHRAYLIGIIAVLAFGSVSTAMAGEFNQKWSGWFMNNPEADVDGDGIGGEANFLGRGTFGRTHNHAVTDIVFNGAPCDIDPVTGVPSGVSLDVIEHSNILVTSKGDQIFRTLSDSQPSTVCFNFVKGSSTLIAYLDIVGGTGRFEGATGSTVLITQIVFVGLHNSITGSEEGDIFGVGNRKHHDDD